MKINYINNIRNEFRSLKERRVIRNNTIEIQNAMFRVDQPTIFGERNEKYIEAELEWYKSQSLNVNDLFDIYGSVVKIWDDVSDNSGYINSNYGWCVYSKEMEDNMIWLVRHSQSTHSADKHVCITLILRCIRELYSMVEEITCVLLMCNTTCLLYTSPSPRDRQKSRMPSSA